MIQIKILRYLLTGLQLLLLVAVGVLQKLTETKGLVMQHVYVRKIQNMSYFTMTNRLILIAGLIIVVAAMLYLKRNQLKKHISLMLVSALTIVSYLLPIGDLLTYTYLLTVVLGVMVIEFIKYGFSHKL